MKIIITGSCGILGTELCRHFADRGHEIIGIDNNQRARFFGPRGDTKWARHLLEKELHQYTHWNLDIRDRLGILEAIRTIKPDAIIHTAAQPSTDRATEIPFEAFDTNANGTQNLLEGLRRYSRDRPFVFISTNKVYGDGPNQIRLKELDTRYAFDDPRWEKGIDESFGIDMSGHSIFGASKVAADVLVQEYGRQYEMPTCSVRVGCISCPTHAILDLPTLLNRVVKCNVTERSFRVFGYQGKQVRDHLHSHDLATFIECFIQNPRTAEVYNLGGGKENACSIREALSIVENLTAVKQKSEYMECPDRKTLLCYYSDLTRVHSHYPGWKITINLEDMLRRTVEAWLQGTKGDDSVVKAS